jgi:hypothetical protein
MFQSAFLKRGNCLGLKNSGERSPTSDFDWLDWASWEAAKFDSSNLKKISTG